MSLFNHQKEAVQFFMKNHGVAAFFHDIGCGKTRSAIEAYTALKGKFPNVKAIVFCPLSLIESAWAEDIRRFSSFTYLNLHRTPVLDHSKNIYITNFESVLTDKKVSLLKELFSKDRWLCIIDESSKLKNNRSQTTKQILAFRKYFDYRIIMSGTPAPNSEMEYWAQMTFLKDRIFHPSFYAFRNNYFDMRRDNQIVPGQVLSKLNIHEMFKKGYKYFISPKKRKDLVDRMAPYCHFVEKEKVLDLPDTIDQYRIFELGEKQAKIYSNMKELAIASILEEGKGDQFIIAKIALAKMMKLRQIISGFAIDEFGKTFATPENPKLGELEDLVEEIGKKQAIIWCNFKREIDDVAKLLGDRACFMYGDVTISDREQAVVDFKSGAKQFLVANPASAGHGLTFVNANIEIFYSLDFSYEKYEQARGRIHRIGQKNNCLYIHLMGRETIDGHIMDVLKKKKDIETFVKEFINERNAN